ncbi:uncharacterized protein METZ01_LOCUS313102, partial [marine metagenome]
MKSYSIFLTTREGIAMEADTYRRP